MKSLEDQLLEARQLLTDTRQVLHVVLTTATTLLRGTNFDPETREQLQRRLEQAERCLLRGIVTCCGCGAPVPMRDLHFYQGTPFGKCCWGKHTE